MHKIIFSTFLLILIFTISGCDRGDSVKQPKKPLIYEGMPSSELTLTLGQPDSVQQGGTVYNADLNKTQNVEKWYYETRTVVLIDDTIKMPSLKER